MPTHKLKVHPQFWDGIKTKKKAFELRRNDRCFMINDILHLEEYYPQFGYSGNMIVAVVSYILHAEDCPGLQPGFCILGLDYGRETG